MSIIVDIGLEFFFPIFLIYAIYNLVKGNKGIKTPQTKVNGFKGRKLNEFNKNIRTYFDHNEEIQINDTISIKAEKNTGRNPYQLYVYYGEERICKIEEFSCYYPKTYMDILDPMWNYYLRLNHE